MDNNFRVDLYFLVRWDYSKKGRKWRASLSLRFLRDDVPDSCHLHFLQQVIVLRTIHCLVTVRFHLTLKKSTPYKFQWQTRLGRLIDQSSSPVYLSYDSFEFTVRRVINFDWFSSCKRKIDVKIDLNCANDSSIRFPFRSTLHHICPLSFQREFFFSTFDGIICLFESRSTAHG